MRSELLSLSNRISKARHKVGKTWDRLTNIGRSPERDAYAVHNRAMEHHNAGRHKDALEDYARALELMPDDPYALRNRGLLLYELERHDEALSDLARSLYLRERYNPEHPDTLKEKGEFYCRAERYEDAVAVYNRALQLVPKQPEVLQRRGIALNRLGFYEDALADFSEAYRLSPGLPESLRLRASVLEQMGRYGEAVGDLSRCIELRPDDATLYKLRGEIEEASGNVEAATSDFCRAFNLEPDSEYYCSLCCRLLVNRRRNDEAYALFMRLLERTSTLGSYASALLGIVYIRMERFDEALTLLDSALALDPRDKLLLLVRASALHITRRYAEAIADFTACLEIDDTYANALAGRAVAHARLGNVQQARDDMSRAEELRPDDPSNFYNWACFHAVTSDTSAAIEALKVAVERNPQFRSDAESDPDFESLRQDSRFSDILAK
ncbi:MAG TPA: tetratricopeptide repeat protein [Chloroflexia bacterium]|jgi:tetratricopeptide (TPR) repeat protein